MSQSDDKPPYRVPTMEEIRSLPWNGFNAVSTFSGCGGSSLGYKMAGFRMLWASEFIPAAQETYRANHGGTILDCRDIREVQPQDILSATGLGVGEIDLFDGSPPCASFSTAGKREKGWGEVKKYSDTKQRTDDLFYEYIRLIRGTRPKTFVAENVSGLVKGTAKGYFLRILAALKESGYRVSCRVLDAQWLGVPQTRQRTIFVGVREDIGKDPAHPAPLPYRYSVRDALPWIKEVRQIEVYNEPDRVACDEPCPTVTNSGIGAKRIEKVVVESETDISRYASGGNTSTASVCHPTEKRKFTIAELRRICGFPDDFILTGTYAQQWERLGRAVPPVMMSHIAATVRDKILRA